MDPRKRHPNFRKPPFQLPDSSGVEGIAARKTLADPSSDDGFRFRVLGLIVFSLGLRVLGF